ncbi:hypothetical protein BGX34_003599 [Mortierella sp. NVP85]|nr:hypothetical protein BGX34_003599 [Mortierella sp. NVP85]
MSASPPQAFRSRSSSKLISIPTRHDTRSGKNVVRWKDILQFFKDAQGVMNGGLAVLFLTDDDLEDLIPLRIAHHPGVVLEVVMEADDQPDQSTVMAHISNVAPEPVSSRIPEDMGGHYSFDGTVGGDTRPSTRDVATLRITEIDDSQALVVHSQSVPSETRVSLHASSPLYNATAHQSISSVQGHSISSTDPFVDEGASRISLQMDNIMAQQEELRQLKEQVQQMQQRMDEVQKTMEHASQQAQDSPPPANHSQQQQEALAMQQQVLQQMDEVLQKIQLVDQRTHCFQQQLQQHIDTTLQRTQEMDQQNRRLDEALQKMQKMEQQERISQERPQQEIDGTYQELQQDYQNTPGCQQQPPRVDDTLPMCLDQEQCTPEQLPKRVDESQKPQQKDQQGCSKGGRPQVPNDKVTEDRTQQSPSQTLEVDRENPQSEPQHQADDSSTQSLPPPPSLFIILPKVIPTVSGEETLSPQFRAHFLCESDTYIEDRQSNDIHEIHFMDHPGYDIINPDKFFHIYRTLLLSVLSIVSFSVKRKGLLIPPLVLSSSTTDTAVDQDQSPDDREKINGLIDQAIRHLHDIRKETTIIPLELVQLKQYLKVKDGEDAFGGLIPMAMPYENFIWVCSEYQSKCHELTMQHLKDLVTTNGGKCSVEKGNIKIEIVSYSLGRQLRDQVVNLCKTQTSGIGETLKVFDLKLHCNQWTSSTTDIVINLINITSIELEFPRLSITINVSDGCVEDVVVKINHLSMITQDDLDFIQQCYPARLSIVNTPQKDDEDQLVDIIRYNPRLTELHIGSIVDRFFTIIDLVVSTHEKICQKGDHSVPRTRKVKVMDKDLTTFDKDKKFERYCHVVSTVTFCMDSTAFDMETDMKLQIDQIPSGSPVREFIQQYGWSIRTLYVEEAFDNQFAALLDKGTRKRGSKITLLDLNTSSLTVPGLDALDRAIKRSQSFTNLWLRLNNLEKDLRRVYATIALERYGKQLTSFNIHTTSPNECIPALAQAFPTRQDFPVLRRFVVNTASSQYISVDCFEWIISMASTSSQETITSPSSTTAPLEKSLASLEFIDLSQVLPPYGWESLIRVIDFSVLIELHLNRYNFTNNSVQCLASHIERFGSNPMPLRRICIPSSRGYYNVDVLSTKLTNRSPPIDFVYW